MRSTDIFVGALLVAAGRVAARNDPTTNTATGKKGTPTVIHVCVLIFAGHVVAQACCDEATGISCFCICDDVRSAVEECMTSNCLEEREAAASDFRLHLCSSGAACIDQPTESLSASASSASAFTTYRAHSPRAPLEEEPPRTPILNQPSKITVPYTPTTSATDSAINSALTLTITSTDTSSTNSATRSAIRSSAGSGTTSGTTAASGTSVASSAADSGSDAISANMLPFWQLLLGLIVGPLILFA